MIFETDRLAVRPWTLDDVEAALEMYGDVEVMRYLGRDGPGATIGSVEEMRDRLERAIAKYPPNQKYIYAAVVFRESGQVIGTALLKPLELSDGKSSLEEIEIGWHLRRSCWGLGFGTEIGLALIRHGFDVLELPALHAIAYPENVASLRIMQKIGMRHLGSTDRYYGVVAEHYLIERES